MKTHGIKPEVEAFDLSMIFQAAAMERDGARWSLELGGHCRTGMEDNVRLDRDTLAPSNAALVQAVVQMCEERPRPGTCSACLRFDEFDGDSVERWR
jgi:uncharacterized protein (DUF849 family)